MQFKRRDFLFLGGGAFLGGVAVCTGVEATTGAISGLFNDQPAESNQVPEVLEPGIVIQPLPPPRVEEVMTPQTREKLEADLKGDQYLFQDVPTHDISPEALDTHAARYDVYTNHEDTESIVSYWVFRRNDTRSKVNRFVNRMPVYLDRPEGQSEAERAEDPRYRLQNVNPDNGIRFFIEGNNAGKEYASGEAYIAVQSHRSDIEIGIAVDKQMAIGEYKERFRTFLQQHVDQSRDTGVINEAIQFVERQEPVYMDIFPLACNDKPCIIPALDQPDGASNYIITIREKY